MPPRQTETSPLALSAVVETAPATTSATARRRPGSTAPPEPAPSLGAYLSLTIKAACAITQISRDTMYGLIAAGEVRSFLMLTRRYIEAASLRDYIARRASEPTTIRPGPNTRTDHPEPATEKTKNISGRKQGSPADGLQQSQRRQTQRKGGP